MSCCPISTFNHGPRQTTGNPFPTRLTRKTAVVTEAKMATRMLSPFPFPFRQPHPSCCCSCLAFLLLSQHGEHPLHQGVLLGVVGLVFAGHLEHHGDDFAVRVRVHNGPDAVGYRLVYQNQADVLSRPVRIEGLLDRFPRRLCKARTRRWGKRGRDERAGREGAENRGSATSTSSRSHGDAEGWLSHHCLATSSERFALAPRPSL